jgi:uncharacterized repeat protein (TIGR03803 family)
MALTSGTKLGPYEILSSLGAGGMGEVYRARDSRLERDVAIKVLPSHLSQSPDLRARFEREAKAISGLQHPNICVLYDVGRQDGVDFLVMEYLEGETLAMRLSRKPMMPDETLRIGIEVADALEKAHRSGIVHRDLKPGNVMLTKGGAKLMDFGLAKLQAVVTGASSGTPAFSAVATLPNMASPITVAGTIVGTVQYMSPEQIQGKEADARSDIFAFGAMLYEMLTGKRAFDGKSQLSVASAVLEKDPDSISAAQPLTPPALEHVVRICLEKDPDQRFQLYGIFFAPQEDAPDVVAANFSEPAAQTITFYGTGSGGGTNAAGTIYTLTSKKKVTVVYDFCSRTNCADGAYPGAGVIEGTDGNFYGTTVGGNGNAKCPSLNGCGTVYEITATGALTTLHSFDSTDGSYPQSPVMQATNGTFYGTTSNGGPRGDGTVFSLSTGLGPFAKTVPASGAAGTAVMILGNDLNGTTSVTFNGKTAEFKVVSATEITTTVPAGATTGTVEVVTPGRTLKSFPFQIL